MNKPLIYFVHKGSSNFCSELIYDPETNQELKCKPDEFYDIVSKNDTIDGGIKMVEHSAYMTAVEALKEFAKGESQWMDGVECMHMAREALQKLGVKI